MEKEKGMDYDKMSYDELQETLVEVIENDELSANQMKWILEYIQGNGYTNQIRRLMDNIDEH